MHIFTVISNPLLSRAQSNRSTVHVHADEDGEHDFGAYPSTPWAACLDGCPCLKPAAGPSHPEALGSTTGNRPEKRKSSSFRQKPVCSNSSSY